MTHICVGELIIIGSANGLSPGRRQAITWTNAGILLTGPLGTNFSEIVSEIQSSSFKKMHLKMSSVKWRPFCLGLNVLTSVIFAATHTFCCCYSAHNSSFAIYLWSFLLTPVTLKYLFLAFRDGGYHFLLQYIHNSTGTVLFMQYYSIEKYITSHSVAEPAK